MESTNGQLIMYCGGMGQNHSSAKIREENREFMSIL